MLGILLCWPSLHRDVHWNRRQMSDGAVRFSWQLQRLGVVELFVAVLVDYLLALRINCRDSMFWWCWRCERITGTSFSETELDKQKFLRDALADEED